MRLFYNGLSLIAIILIKMVNTLFTFVVHFCLNENTLNHLIKKMVLPSCHGKEEGSHSLYETR